jgi:hypothetical protein
VSVDDPTNPFNEATVAAPVEPFRLKLVPAMLLVPIAIFPVIVPPARGRYVLEALLVVR